MKAKCIVLMIAITFAIINSIEQQLVKIESGCFIIRWI